MKMDFITGGNFHPVTDHAISTNDENLSLFIHLGHLVAIKMILKNHSQYYYSLLQPNTTSNFIFRILTPDVHKAY